MKLGTFLTGMMAITLFSLGSFFSLIFYFDPFEVSKFILILVYLTLFFGLTGFSTLIGFFIRKILKKENLSFKDATNSFWQGILLSSILIIALIITSNI